jgi:hypothetical protein
MFWRHSEVDRNCYTAMSWALSQGALDAMDLSFSPKDTDLKKFLESRHYFAGTETQQEKDLGAVVAAANGPDGNNPRLEKVLQVLINRSSIQAVQPPVEASKRK